MYEAPRAAEEAGCGCQPFWAALPSPAWRAPHRGWLRSGLTACYASGVAAIRIHTVLSSTTIDLPELAPLVGHRVELTVREDAARSWPEGWFDAIEGAIEDPTFQRAPQPELELRAASEP